MPPKQSRQIFVINGKPRVGKTTFGLLVRQQLETLKINFKHLSSIDLVKHLLLPEQNIDQK